MHPKLPYIACDKKTKTNRAIWLMQCAQFAFQMHKDRRIREENGKAQTREAGRTTRRQCQAKNVHQDQTSA